MVEKIVPRGLGLAFAPKLTIFVPLAAPGDRLIVSIRDLSKRSAFAEIVEVLSPSPQRIEPPCVYFGKCGGCDFQQMDYASQLAAKVEIIRDSLRRIGRIEHSGEIAIEGSPAQFEYRSRAQWHADTESRSFGYFKRGSKDVIDIEKCPILAPPLETTLERLRAEIKWEDIWDDAVEFEAASGDDGQVSVMSAAIPELPSEITFSAAGEKYRYSAESFFQGNQTLVEPLVRAAVGDLSGDRALDLYCGVGLFSLPLARRFQSVMGVEDSNSAVHFARKNAEDAGLGNLEFKNERVDRFLQRGDVGRPDLLLMDPPRSGAEVETINTICRLGPGVISYVSCDPAILARDLRIFLDAGYTIDQLKAFDLFPQTHHVETVVRLIRP